MHRTQGEKFQIHSDFDEHFREVWTGDLRTVPTNSMVFLPRFMITQGM